MTINQKIADMLRRFVQGTVDCWEFDDFISTPQERNIDVFRLQIARMNDDYPPDRENQYCNLEGMREILRIANEIEASK